MTLGDVGYADGDIIEFVPFESVNDMVKGILQEKLELENRLHQQKRWSESFSQSAEKSVEGVEASLLAEVFSATFEDYLAALKRIECPVSVIMKTLSLCTDFEVGKKLPSGVFTDGFVYTQGPVCALVPAVCLNRFEVARSILECFPSSAHQVCDAKQRNILHYAVQFCAQDMVSLLAMAGGANANQPDASGVTPVVLACSLGRTNLLKILLDNGCKLTDRIGGRGPLQFAAIHGRTDTVEFLLNVPELYISEVDEDGSNVLHLAACTGFLSVVLLLLEWRKGTKLGLDVNAMDNKGQTALHIAAENSNVAVAELLCNIGWRIHVSQLDANRESAISICSRNGHVGVLKILMDVMRASKSLTGVTNAYEEEYEAAQAEAREAAAVKQKREEEAQKNKEAAQKVTKEMMEQRNAKRVEQKKLEDEKQAAFLEGGANQKVPEAVGKWKN